MDEFENEYTPENDELEDAPDAEPGDELETEDAFPEEKVCEDESGEYNISFKKASPVQPTPDARYIYADPPVQPKPKKPHRALKVIALLLCCALLSAAAGFGGAYFWTSRAEEEAENDPVRIYEGERETHPLEIVRTDTSSIMTPAEVYAQNVNSTVGIRTSITTNFWGYQTTSAASGSGFILSEDGYIITNFHVIDSSSAVKVTTYDGTSYDARIVGYDQSNDIALLKIEAEGLDPVILGDSDALNVGDSVLAIGNPLGELTFSLTSGIVSALNRHVTLSGGISMNLIQTDCAINSGNSGGALFNMYGEVVGITNAKYSSSSSGASIDNICFAIPLNSVKDIIESIMTTGEIVKPYIGLSVKTISDEEISYGLPAGVAVKEIRPDSPAEKAGLQVNDIITKVNTTDISDQHQLIELVGSFKPNDVLTLSVFRQGQMLELELTVGKQVKSAFEETAAQQQQQQQSINPFSGFPWSFFG